MSFNPGNFRSGTKSSFGVRNEPPPIRGGVRELAADTAVRTAKKTAITTVTTSLTTYNLCTDKVCNFTRQVEDTNRYFMVNDANNWIADTVSLDKLSDIKFSIPAKNGDVLTYDSTTKKWTSKPPILFKCDDLNGCSLNSIGNAQALDPIPNSILTYNGDNWTAQQVNDIFNSINDISINILDNNDGYSNKIGARLIDHEDDLKLLKIENTELKNNITELERKYEELLEMVKIMEKIYNTNNIHVCDNKVFYAYKDMKPKSIQMGYNSRLVLVKGIKLYMDETTEIDMKDSSKIIINNF